MENSSLIWIPEKKVQEEFLGFEIKVYVASEYFYEDKEQKA